MNYHRELLEKNELLMRESDEWFQKYVDANEARIDAEAKVVKLRRALSELLATHETVFPDRPATARARTALQETEQ